MASGSIAVCIGTPFDIALVRLQADSMAPVEERRNYKNVFDVSDFYFIFSFMRSGAKENAHPCQIRHFPY
eukprot:6237502-Ditylum_brightwellii.AAC.1